MQAVRPLSIVVDAPFISFQAFKAKVELLLGVIQGELESSRASEH